MSTATATPWAYRAFKIIGERMAKPAPVEAPVLRPVCPAPTSSAFRCGRDLPCSSHAVSDWREGYVLYGHSMWRKVRKGEK